MTSWVLDFTIINFPTYRNKHAKENLIFLARTILDHKVVKDFQGSKNARKINLSD